ncbi:transient receptor potential channel pyrexia-like [Gigaspora margarita]|uniref:Transient receptor potential channel pyrexia-like n=1 Tax=Gigaspora margarita TaxID=4874 RepID=A0A8H4AB06_GIGMA|nr:transient receptor potential channel pyrexia-like [Gigaspora margarita]
MYDIKLEKNDLSKLEVENALSSRKIDKIKIDTSKQKIFEFTSEQCKLITSEQDKLGWSITVSDKYNNDEPHKQNSRLLAISCISKDDMTYKNPKDPNDIITRFTIVFSFNLVDHSIKKIKTLDNYGRKIKLFSKVTTDKSNQNTNTGEDNQNTGTGKTSEEQSLHLDKFFLTILNANGIHKDATVESAQYMELYDLRTNQLVNTFKRQNLNTLNLIADIPDFVAVSHSDKLLAYASGNYVKLYSIDCGLEIASIKLNKTGKKSSNDYYDDYFMHFFKNDESLLIYRSKQQWAIWNMFGLEQKSIELKDHQLEIDLKMVNIFCDNDCYQFERSNSFVIIVKNKEENEKTKYSEDRQIYDGSFLNHLKSKKDNQNFKTLLLNEKFVEKHFIFDLDNKPSELDDYYHIFEPWLYTDKKATPRNSAYLDNKKETLLLIGNHMIQVWHDQAKQDQAKQYQAKQDQAKQDQNKKRTLEFISIIDENDHIEIKYAIRKFKISFQDSKKNIEIGCDDDIVLTVIRACQTLKFLNSIYDSSGAKDKFIQLYPIVWRLLDICYHLLGILIEAEEKLLIKHILFNEKNDIVSPGEKHVLKKLDSILSKLETNKNSNDKMPEQDYLLHEKSLHIPQYTSWKNKENTINMACSKASDVTNDDPVYLGYLLEYYSNKALEDIGWMISVGEILPKLYTESHNIDNPNNGFFKSYLQILFYKPCFCSKGLDIPFFDFITIPPSMSNSLEVFIPLTQLIPKVSSLIVKEISKEKIPNVRMVPFVDFATNNKTFLLRKGDKYTNFLKSLIFPNQFLALKEIPIPILSIIENVESYHDDPFYFNPSIEAMLNFIFIFLGYAAYIGLSGSLTTYEITNGNTKFNLTGGEPENIFSNPFSSIISAYNWNSTALDAWGFWPLIIISVLGNIVFIIILQNVIISFMSGAFESADKYGKRTVLNFQSCLIYDYARLENSAFTTGKSDFDKQFKKKLRVKYVCFYDEPLITKAWRDEGKEWDANPIYWNAESQISTENECKYFMEDVDLRFIWISKKHHERRDSII